jgi:hypothetical protein
MTEPTEKSIREFCEQYSGANTIINQVLEHLAMFSKSIDRAAEKAQQTSESADRLAVSLGNERLNPGTFYKRQSHRNAAPKTSIALFFTTAPCPATV